MNLKLATLEENLHYFQLIPGILLVAQVCAAAPTNSAPGKIEGYKNVPWGASSSAAKEVIPSLEAPSDVHSWDHWTMYFLSIRDSSYTGVKMIHEGVMAAVKHAAADETTEFFFLRDQFFYARAKIEENAVPLVKKQLSKQYGPQIGHLSNYHYLFDDLPIEMSWWGTPTKLIIVYEEHHPKHAKIEGAQLIYVSRKGLKNLRKLAQEIEASENAKEQNETLKQVKAVVE